jgi:hypothetical protein
MRSGPRPAHLQGESRNDETLTRIASAKRGSGKIILVHGYCSSGDAFPVEDFTDYLVFNDPEQNRDLDEFANLVMSFAASQVHILHSYD